MKMQFQTEGYKQPSQQQGNLMKLKYNIIYCSGEDQEYPVTELLDPTPMSRGWQSPKFCDYPQEIILQFPNIIKLKQLQFLSHQSKIASKIELFCFVPQGSQAMSQKIPLNEIQFKRLGYLSLDPNERSGFQARELKSVYVDSMAVLLKLIFHKCHLNNYNVFNQIGLIAVNCIGQNQLPNEIMDPGQPPSSSQSSRIPGGGDFDVEPEMLSKVRILEQVKKEFVASENFDQAKAVKEQIDRIRGIGVHLQQLDERKNMASANEDYDAAKVIKSEMLKLKEAARNPWVDDLIKKYQQSHGLSQQQPPMNQSQQQWGQPPPPFGQAPSSSSYNKSQQNFMGGQQPQFNSDVTPMMGTSLEEQVNQMELNRSKKGVQKMGSQQMMNEAVSPPSNQFQKGALGGAQGGMPGGPRQIQPREEPVDVDEQVVPAMKKGGGPTQPEFDDGGGQEEEKDAEPIAGDKVKQAEPLVRVFGDSNVRKVFSKTWQFREEGISGIEGEINDGNFDEGEAFVNGMGVARYTVGDRMAQVAQRSMQFIVNLCRNLRPDIDANLKGELQSYTDPILSALVEKLGDNLQKLRSGAEEALISMAEHHLFGVPLCLNVLLRNQNAAQKDAKKAMNSNKHIIGKYSVLLKMLQNFEFAPEQLEKSVDFALKGVQNQLQDIRNVSYKCMSELYRQMGQDIRNHVMGLRPAQMDLLEQAFAEVDGGKPAKAKQEKPKETITTNIDPTGAKGKKKKAPEVEAELPSDKYIQEKKGSAQKAKGGQAQKAQQENKLTPEEQTCNFCDRFDPEFNEETLDIHYWKECPMLISCWECQQVIEIATLNDHLIEECNYSDNYKLCSKCRVAYHVDEFNDHQHVRIPSNGVACKLCMQAVIPNNEKGWKRHILEEKCEGNTRN